MTHAITEHLVDLCNELELVGRLGVTACVLMHDILTGDGLALGTSFDILDHFTFVFTGDLCD
jgi:hypothetical protein